MMKRRYEIEITEKLNSIIETLAKEKNTTKSDIIRQVINYRFRNFEILGAMEEEYNDKKALRNRVDGQA